MFNSFRHWHKRHPSARRPRETGRATTVAMNGGPTSVVELDPRQLVASMPFAITREAYELIEKTIGSRPAETGAVLGGSRAKGLITHVHPDPTGAITRSTYSPDIAEVNRLLREEWDPEGIDFMGFVHSHPAGNPRPSGGDQVYAERILQALPALGELRMPIVQTWIDTGRYQLNGFVAVRSSELAAQGHLRRPGENGSGVRVLRAPVVIVDEKAIHKAPKDHPYRQRVVNSYDPAVMATTRIVAVGVGGSVGYLESMARSGIGQFVLIDPDVIEPKNIGTQAVDSLDIGRSKVAAMAERLARLNPDCAVWTLQAKESAIDDFGFRQLLLGPLPGEPTVPETTIIGAFTDNFAAQDRCHRLGLQFGVPTLAASVYAEGRGVELAFAAPGLTSACIRCALSSRYRAYLTDGYVNDVTSDGTPLLATDRLNASKQVVTLAMLHSLNGRGDPDHPATARWRRTMEALTDRNLVLTRLDPDSPLRSFRPLSAVTDGRCVIDDTVWTKPTPDGPTDRGGACPDCGGTGDLSHSIGTFADTRVLPTEYGSGRRCLPTVTASA